MDKVPKPEDKRSLLWVGSNLYCIQKRKALQLLGPSIGEIRSSAFIPSSFNKELYRRLKCHQRRY